MLLSGKKKKGILGLSSKFTKCAAFGTQYGSNP